MSVKTDQYEKDELLSRYLEGDLADDEAQAIEEQLQEDEGYQRDLDILRRTLDLMGQMPAVEAPDDFVQKIRQRVRRFRHKRRFEAHNAGFRGTYVMWVGFVVAIVMILYLIAQLSLQPTPRKQGTNPSTPTKQRQIQNKTNTTKKTKQGAKQTPNKTQNTNTATKPTPR